MIEKLTRPSEKIVRQRGKTTKSNATKGNPRIKLTKELKTEDIQNKEEKTLISKRTIEIIDKQLKHEIK